MNKWIYLGAVMASVTCAVMSPRTCAAGPLLDWLSGRTPYYQHQPWHIDRRYPATVQAQPAYAVQPAYATQPTATGVVYQAPAAAPTTPGTVLQTTPDFQTGQTMPVSPFESPTVVPQVAYPSGTAACNNGNCWNNCWLTRGWFAPRTTYRTTWVRLPVTRYRPVTGVQTAYGVPATQPCNGYTWQLRRVPVTTYRPFAGLWSQLFGPPRSVSYFGTQVGAPCATYGTAIPQTAVPTVPQNSPYYPTPAAVPGTTTIVPSAGLGATPSPPVNLAPATNTPVPGRGAVPADRRPSLKPEGNDSSLRMSPPLPPQPNPNQPTPASPGTDPGPLATQEPPAPEQNKNFFNVRPIRDPQPDSGRRIDTIPQLLGPSNHSASVDSPNPSLAWQIVPIRWESVRSADVPHVNSTRVNATRFTAPAPPSTQHPQRRFDDGGWKSAR